MNLFFQNHYQMYFDIVFIDEAHNLLGGDKRSRLLAGCIILCKVRNDKTAFKYLTPFLVSSESLKIVEKGHSVREIKITEIKKNTNTF